jgi:hypothetical protein
MPTSYDSSASTDLPDGPFKDWPGAGPTPEPEEDGFREKVIDLIKARREREQREYEERCEADAAYFSGESDERRPGSTKTKAKAHDTRSTHKTTEHASK